MNVDVLPEMRHLQPAAELGRRVCAHARRARRRRSTSTRRVSATPAAWPSRSTARSTGRARAQAEGPMRPPPQQGRLVRLRRARLGRQGQLLRRPHAQVQVRHAPADRDLGAAHLHRLGLEELPGLDPRRLRQLPVHAQRPGPPAADPPRGREPVPPLPAVHLRPEVAGAEDGDAAQDPARVLRRERG